MEKVSKPLKRMMRYSHDFQSNLLSSLKDGSHLTRKMKSGQMQKGPDIVGRNLGNPILFSTHYRGMEIQNDDSDNDSDDGDSDKVTNPRITRTPTRFTRPTRPRLTTTRPTKILTSSQTTLPFSRTVTPSQKVSTLPVENSTSRQEPSTSSVLNVGTEQFQRSFDVTTFVILPLLSVLSVICLGIFIVYLVKRRRRKVVKDESSPHYRDFSSNNSTIPMTRLNTENVVYYDIDGPPEIIPSTVPSTTGQDVGIYHEIDHLQVSLRESKPSQKMSGDADGRAIPRENEYFKLESPKRVQSYANLSKDKSAEFYDLAKPLSQGSHEENISTPEYFKLETTKKPEYYNDVPVKNGTFEKPESSGSCKKKQPGLEGNEYFTLEKCVQNETKEDATLMANICTQSTDTESTYFQHRKDNDYFTLEIRSPEENKQVSSPSNADISLTSSINNSDPVSDSDTTQKDHEYFTLENVTNA